MIENAFFKYTDVHDHELSTANWSFRIPEGWWSRPWEYIWAIQYATFGGMHVADMGAGGAYRPFKDYLAGYDNLVAAIDGDPKILETPHMKGVEHFECSFGILEDRFQPELFDQIYCISVLEDVVAYALTLHSFKNLLKPEGKIIITVDVPYNPTKSCDHYPGINLYHLLETIDRVGLKIGPVDFSKKNAINHEEFNLCVFHCVLTKEVEEKVEELSIPYDINDPIPAPGTACPSIPLHVTPSQLEFKE